MPATIIAIVAYQQLEHNSRESVREANHTQTKNAGYSLKRWLAQEAKKLDFVVDTVEKERNQVGHSAQIDGISVTTLTNKEYLAHLELLGGNVEKPLFTVADSSHVLSRVTTDTKGTHLAVRLRLADLITPYTSISSTADYCYLDGSGQPIQCSKPVPQSVLAQLFGRTGGAAKASSDHFYVDMYSVSKARISLPMLLGADSWSLIVWQRANGATSTLQGLVALGVPLAAAFALCGLILGAAVLREHLSRLRDLNIHTKRLATGDFDCEITPRDGGETAAFEDDFNHTVRRLKRKFDTLSTLAEIDRLILASQTFDQIGEVLLSRIDALIEVDVACIWFVEQSSNTLTTIVRDTVNDSPVTIIKSELAKDTAQSIAGLSGNIDFASHARTSNYLTPLIARGVTNGYSVAIPVDSSHLANFFVGSKSSNKLALEDIQQLLEFTHRAAVALSNSVWKGKLYYQAHFDVLTQLPNRQMFKDILDAAISRAQREKHSVGVLFIDLDEFKDVNDCHGHAAGDDVLVVVADRLRNSVRASDTVARLGGDEFVVIVPDLNETDTSALIDLRDLGKKLLEKLSVPIAVAEHEIIVTASIGASFCPRDAKNAEDLLRNADKAMYAVKEEGRRGFRFYSEELNENASSKIKLRKEIATALENDEFVLYYQPKIDSRTQLIVGCESLIRWNHPEFGVINPGEFLEEIERSGAIVEVGNWAFITAVKQLADWRRRGLERLCLSANLSRRQFGDRDFIPTVERALAQNLDDPGSLELEITESAPSLDFDIALTLMNRLRELGLAMCIDDFGTGHSSLRQLQLLPISTLKIDRSFVQNIGTNENAEAVIESILALGRSLELRVVAAGVEARSHVDFLGARDCHTVQGFYYSKPVPAADFEKLARSGPLPHTGAQPPPIALVPRRTK